MDLDITITINELLRLMPESAAAIGRLGVDTCCGGSLTLTEAATSAGVPLAALLSAVLDSAAGQPVADACGVRRVKDD